MRDILEQLNEAVGIRGSMVVTKDGIIATSALGEYLCEETVAALVSSLIQVAKRNLEKIGFGDFTEFVLLASLGKILILDADVAFLVILADMRINLNVTIIDINSAIHKIKRKASMENV